MPLNECSEELQTPIIDNILYENTYLLLSGSKDSYKSWLAAYMAVCVATGEPFFNHSVMKTGKVVYVYGEGRMKKRLKSLAASIPNANLANIIPYALRSDLSIPENLQELKLHIPSDTLLIVFDNYEKYWASDTDEKIVISAMELMKDIRGKASVVLIQHFKKNGLRGSSNHAKSKGSSKIVNNADSSISVTKAGSIARGEIYHREQETQDPIVFQLTDLEDGSITLQRSEEGNYANFQISSPASCIEQIKAILKDKLKEPLNKTVIYERYLRGQGIRGLSTTSYHSRFFQQMVDSSFLIKRSESSLYELAPGLPASETSGSC